MYKNCFNSRGNCYVGMKFELAIQLNERNMTLSRKAYNDVMMTKYTFDSQVFAVFGGLGDLIWSRPITNLKFYVRPVILQKL